MYRKIGILFLSIGLLAISFSTVTSQHVYPPFLDHIKNISLPDGTAPYTRVQYVPVFAPTDYSSEIVQYMLQNLTKERVIGYLEEVTAFGPRVTGTEACDDAAVYLYQQFQSMGLAVQYHNWSVSDSLYGATIEASLPGIDQTQDDVFIVCGHYDSVPGSPGADDNGAGTTAVLTAAYLMKNYAFNHTIRFVCFSGEEQGLYGSAYYAQEAIENNENIIGVLNADMMGYADDEESRSHVRVYENEESSWLTEYTIDVSEYFQGDIGITVIPSGFSGGSDHYEFWKVGYDAIFYFESKFNPNYHSPDDVIETMDPEYTSRVSKLILGTLASLAEPVDMDCPKVPTILSGPQKGKPDVPYEYSIVTHDPQGDDVYYSINWDDGSDSGWLGPYTSGESITVSKTWQSKGRYQVTVKAKDTDDHESDWSSTYPVRMSYLLGQKVFFQKVWAILSHYSSSHAS